jgi:AcrR family transcriptional regulator
MAARPQALEPKQERSRETRRRLLDAAVEELLENGYAGLTSGAVAQRVGVSRGAAQNHFPQRSTLIAEAIRHLGRQQTEALRRVLGATSAVGATRLVAALNVIFEQYSGGRFAAIIELSLAARRDPVLKEVIAAEERAIGRELSAVVGELFTVRPDAGEDRLAQRWATALSTVRGLALLKLLGHPAASVDRQWQSTRESIVSLFDDLL